MSHAPSNRARTLYLPGVFERPPAAETILLEAWVKSTYAPLKVAFGDRGQTLATTIRDIGLFCRFFRERENREPTLGDLNDGVADEFFVWHTAQRRCKSQATANRSRRSLSSVWRAAARKGLCYPPEDLRMAKVNKHLPLAWSMDELGKLLATAKTYPWQWYKPRGSWPHKGDWAPPKISAGLWMHTIISTLYFTGLRISSLMLTPTVKLDLAAKGVLVPASVQKHRTDQFFPLPDDVIAAWRELDVHGRGVLRLGDDWPYDRHGKISGRPAYSSGWTTLNAWLRRCLRAAGLVLEDESNFRRQLWHKLRRTFATHLAVAKGTEAARRWLGHSSFEVTMRYIDLRFMPSINPVEVLPRPTIPIPEADIIPLRMADAS